MRSKESSWGKIRETAYHVRRMLIRRSQLQPVTMAAAAGGNKIETCRYTFSIHVTLLEVKDHSTRIRITSEDLTIVALRKTVRR